MYDENNTNEFYLSSFESNGDGTFNFYNNNEAYNSTWVFLFINNEMHLNINIQGQNIIKENWNFDWKVDEMSENSITIINNASKFKLSKTCTQQITYNLGDNAPSGGVVIYDKGSYSNGWRYIEASKSYINLNELQWGCNNSLLSDCSNTLVGLGLLNTKEVLKFHFQTNYYTDPTNCSTLSNGSVSAQKTCILEQAEFNDWLLPNNEECQLIFSNINLLNNNLVLSNYWSSTQINTTNAAYFNISNNTIEEIDKASYIMKTLPIRYF